MTCPVPTPCIGALTDPPTGGVGFFPIESASPENDWDCTDDGVYVPKTLQVVNCTTSAPAEAVGVPSGTRNVLLTSGSLTLANPTTDRRMHCIVHLMFGALRFTMTQSGGMSVADYLRLGPLNTLGVVLPSDDIGRSTVNDGNNTFPDAKTVLSVPGRAFSQVVAPSLPPGTSLQVLWERRYSTTNASPGSLQDILAQPTVVQLWGIVV